MAGKSNGKALGRKKPGRTRAYVIRTTSRQKRFRCILDGHSAESVVNNLGLTSTNLLYRWKDKLLAESGPAAATLGLASSAVGRRIASRRTGT